MPAGGGVGLITIGESSITRLTDRVPVRDGVEESATAIVMG
jgi:hypothetical protein